MKTNLYICNLSESINRLYRIYPLRHDDIGEILTACINRVDYRIYTKRLKSPAKRQKLPTCPQK
jgi:hypothetical protein